ncbi:15913_t:CDS:2, partial [Acaulospora colombiana]
PTSSLAKSLVLHGRTLDVVRAVTRETANTLRDAGVKMREKADKRNMYLMREGVIFPNSPAASTIPPVELEKRINSYNQRRALLRTNPSLFVSKTRLSIRQIPTFVSERSLKRLALHAIQQFDKEVEEGDREGLNADELDDNAPIVDSLMGGEVKLPERETKDAKRAKTRRGAPGRVKQAKVIRVADRVDAVTGKGKSKGYGFLELEHHSDALKVLRWANNNPDVNPVFKEWWHEELNDTVSGLEKKPEKTEEDTSRVRRIKDLLSTMEEKEDKVSKRTLIVEFSIENSLVVKKREERGGPRPGNSRPVREGNESHERISVPRRKGAQRDTDSEQSRPAKKRKEQLDEDHGSLIDRISEKSKSVNPLGSIIGRKRKMKK